MPQRYRAFSEDFIRHMGQRNWPAIKTVQSWFQRESGGLKRERYTQLKRGDALPEKYASGLVRLMLANAQSESPTYYGEALRSFLQSCNIVCDAHLSVDATLDAVCDRVSERPALKSMAMDLLQQGFTAISALFCSPSYLNRNVRPCESQEEVDAAVEWLYVAAGRGVSPKPETISPADAIAIATANLKSTLGDYQSQARIWWSFNSWTVSLSMGVKRPTGMVIILPLKEKAYKALLDGKHKSYEVTSGDLEVPSPFLLLEAVAERPHDAGAEALPIAKLSKSLYMTLLAQIGVFSYQVSPRRVDAIRILSFAGTPTNKKRLKSFGFRPTGRYMPDTDQEYFEKTLGLKGTVSRDMTFLSIARLCGQTLAADDDD
jgi:hypothetical protein